MALLYNERLQENQQQKRTSLGLSASPQGENSSLPTAAPRSPQRGFAEDPRNQKEELPEFANSEFFNIFNFYKDQPNNGFEDFMDHLLVEGTDAQDQAGKNWITEEDAAKRVGAAVENAAKGAEIKNEVKQGGQFTGVPWEDMESALGGEAFTSMTPQAQQKAKDLARKQWELDNPEESATPEAVEDEGMFSKIGNFVKDAYSENPLLPSGEKQEQYQQAAQKEVAGVGDYFQEKGALGTVIDALTKANPVYQAGTKLPNAVLGLASKAGKTLAEAYESPEGQAAIYGKEAGEQRKLELDKQSVIDARSLEEKAVADIANKKTEEQKATPTEAAKGVEEVVSLSPQIPEVVAIGAARYNPHETARNTVESSRAKNIQNGISEMANRRDKQIEENQLYNTDKNFWHNKPFLKAMASFALSAATYGADLGQAFNRASAIYEDQVGIDRRTAQANEKLNDHTYQAVEEWVRTGDSKALEQGRLSSGMKPMGMKDISTAQSALKSEGARIGNLGLDSSMEQPEAMQQRFSVRASTLGRGAREMTQFDDQFNQAQTNNMLNDKGQADYNRFSLSGPAGATFMRTRPSGMGRAMWETAATIGEQGGPKNNDERSLVETYTHASNWLNSYAQMSEKSYNQDFFIETYGKFFPEQGDSTETIAKKAFMRNSIVAIANRSAGGQGVSKIQSKPIEDVAILANEQLAKGVIGMGYDNETESQYYEISPNMAQALGIPPTEDGRYFTTPDGFSEKVVQEAQVMADAGINKSDIIRVLTKPGERKKYDWNAISQAAQDTRQRRAEGKRRIRATQGRLSEHLHSSI